MYKAPKGGAIVNNQYYKGGKFIAKTRQRIRDVAARFKLSMSVKEMFPTEERLGERFSPETLKKFEEEYAIPEAFHLSGHAAKGEYAPVWKILEFLQHASTARLSKLGLLKKLTNPSTSDAEKAFHLFTSLVPDYELSQRNAWYTTSVHGMERILHPILSQHLPEIWGRMGPDNILEGKHAPHIYHPGMVIFKMPLAYTSGSLTPDQNLSTAMDYWLSAARRSPNGEVIPYLSEHNEEGFADWLKDVSEKVGPELLETSITDTPEGVSKWLRAVTKKHPDVFKDKVGYKSTPARVDLDPSSPTYGRVFWIERKGHKTKLDGSRFYGDIKRGTTVPYPLLSPSGHLQPKAWSLRGSTIAHHTRLLKSLYAHFREGRDPIAAHTELASWLLTKHPPSEFDRIHAATDKIAPDASSLYRRTLMPRGTILPGSFIFGHKYGSFHHGLNHIFDYYVHDMWINRGIGRYIGRILVPNKKKRGKSKEAPIDRFILPATRLAYGMLSKHVGATPAESQGDLWGHEKDLFVSLGADPEEVGMGTYEKAAEKYVAKQKAIKLQRDSLRSADPFIRLALLREALGLTIPIKRYIEAFSTLIKNSLNS